MWVYNTYHLQQNYLNGNEPLLVFYNETLYFHIMVWMKNGNSTRRNTVIREREKHALFCFKIKYIVLYGMMECVLFPDFESVYMNSFQKLHLCYHNVVDWWIDVTKFKKWEYGVVLYVVFIQHVMKTGHMFQALGNFDLNWDGVQTDKEFEHANIQNKMLISSA